MASNKDQYSEKDFVQVVDAAGNVQPDAVPKSWIGTDLLPEGYKQATKARVDKDAEAKAKAEADARAAAEAAAKADAEAKAKAAGNA